MAIYSVFGAAVLTYRQRGIAAERARVQALGEAAALERLARTVLALRDLANTTLQTLEIAVTLLRDKSTDATPIIDRVEHAVDRLREGHELLGSYDSHLRWDRTDESFDALEVLHRTAPPPKPR